MKLFRRSETCPHCGADLLPESRFCPSCGQAVGGGKIRCGFCGALLPSDARFCAECGKPVGDWQEPAMESHRWKRSPEDFAVRVDVDDVPGFLRKQLIVEPGTQAILVAEGRNLGVVGPGTYTLQSLLDKIASLGSVRKMSAILVDTGDVTLHMTIPDLFTRDPLKIEMDCELTVHLHDPLAFLINVMRGRRNFSLAMLRDFLFGEVQNAASECVAQHSITELGTNLALKDEFAVYIAEHLNRTLERSGLTLTGVRTLHYRHRRWDAIREREEEYLLQATEEEARLKGQRRLLDVWNENQLLEIARDEAEAVHHERRAAVRERMRHLLLSETLAETQDLNALEKALREVDREKLLRDNEWEELQRDLRERWEDHEAARAHLLAKLAAERDYERRLADLKMRRDLETQELEFEQDLARRRMQQEIEIEEQRYLFELKRRRAEEEFQRDQRLRQAEVDLHIRKLSHDQEIAEDLQELDLARKGFEILAEKHEREFRLRWEQEQRMLDLRLQEQRFQLEAEMRRLREQHEAELQRIQALSSASAEALIAMAGPEQAALLAELKRTEMLKGMSEEQILALAAEKSPHIIEAFKERYRSASSPEVQAEIKALYERMLVEQKHAAEILSEAQERQAQRLQEMFEKALDSQREATIPFANRSAEKPVIVVPNAGLTTMRAGSGAEEPPQVILCRRCHTKLEAGTRYCHNCGEAQF